MEITENLDYMIKIIRIKARNTHYGKTAKYSDVVRDYSNDMFDIMSWKD